MSDGLRLTIDVSRPMDLMEKFPAQVMAGAEQGIEESVLLLENAVKSNILGGREGGYGAAVATGTLLGAVFSDIHGTPTSIVGTVAVAPPADQYALVVEEGRRPNQKQPPSGALIVWARRKLASSVGVIASVLSQKAGRKRPSRQDREGAERSLAFVLARSIGKKGFPGVHMFAQAFTEQRARVIEIVQARILDAVAKVRGA